MPKPALIEDKIRYTVPFPRKLGERLTEQAKREQRGVSNLIRLIVTDYLEKSC
ncbi:MAG: ribbon-helix-helix domain-containing protein [Microcystaceae cyanobacterium]